MMYDLQRSDVHMHDVRMQLVDVFRWGGGFREVGATQGSVVFRSQDWKFPIADGCAGIEMIPL